MAEGLMGQEYQEESVWRIDSLKTVLAVAFPPCLDQPVHGQKCVLLLDELAIVEPSSDDKDRDVDRKNMQHKKLDESVIPSSAPESGRQRVQLDFTPEALERLRQIKEMAEAKTNAEVVRNALRLYEWFLRQKQENYKFQLVKDNMVKEVEIVL